MAHAHRSHGKDASPAAPAARSPRPGHPPKAGPPAAPGDAAGAPGARAREIVRKHREFLFPSVSTYYETPLVADRGEGKYVYDVDGRQYLDFFGGILTVGVGHCHPHVTERVVAQQRKLQHVSTLYPTEPIVDLAERMAAITPGRLKKSFFTNSGTEANETAILAAKVYTGRSEVLALRYSYSGRSTLAMSLTGTGSWRMLGTEIPGIKHVANAYCYRCPFGLTYPGCELRCARDIEEVIKTTTAGRIAAFIAEPIQGVGGFITPPPEYFRVAVDIVRRYGGVFIADEVQTGFGRTGGTWFGIEHWGVEPDIITCAKAMANGAPIGATVATPEVADAMRGLTISTFGGNPVSMVAALATIEVIEAEGLVENAAAVGAYLRGRLEELQAKYPVMGDVRGMGLMQGIEVVRDPRTKEPAPDIVARVFEVTKREGLLIGKGGLYGNVIRISPPLNITRGDVDDAVAALDRAFAEATAR